MVIIFIRCALILLLLLVVMRLMGKRQIGEMQPYEFIITLLIAEVACVPMSDVSIPLLYGVSSIIAIFIIHQILALLEQLGQGWKNTINGEPSIIINSNGINHRELRKNNLDVDDLIESLRSSGNFALDGIKYAILEANGKLSVLKNDENTTPSLPVLIIDCGVVMKDNLKKIGKDYQFLHDFLTENSISSEKKVDVMTVDENGKVYLQERDKHYKILSVRLDEDIVW